MNDNVILEIKEEDGEQVYDTLTDEELLKDVYSRFLKQQGIEEEQYYFPGSYAWEIFL